MFQLFFQELRSLEAELYDKQREQRQTEERLKQREKELAEREIDLLERELNIMILQQVSYSLMNSFVTLFRLKIEAPLRAKVWLKSVIENEVNENFKKKIQICENVKRS